MMRFSCFVACAWLLCAACASDADGGGASWPVANAGLELTSVDWNAAHVDLGKIAAIIEDGDQLVVFGEHGATLIAGGAAAGTDTSITHWQSASRIAAADGSGFWAVGVDEAGEVQRLRGGTSLESVSDRYGLLGAQVARVAAMATPFVAFALHDEVAVADGVHVTRYAANVAAAHCFAGDAHRVAFASSDGGVQILDATMHQLTTVTISGALGCAFSKGQLWVLTSSALFVQTDADVHTVFQASGLSGLAVSGDRLWFSRGQELCIVHPDQEQIACGRAAGLASGSALIGSASGDAWALHAGSLARYALPSEGDEAKWRASAFSVYARVCSSCHAPGGPSGIDLSTYAAWQSKRDKIITRVLDAKNMPPDRALAEQDRASIADWAGPR